MNDGAQAGGGLRFYFFGERQNAVVSAEIRVQTNGTRITQFVNGRIPCAVADHNGLLPGQKMASQGETDATASTGNQDRARLDVSHGYLL